MTSKDINSAVSAEKRCDVNVSDELARSHLNQRSVCQTNKEVLENYAKTAGQYDSVVGTLEFGGPRKAVDILESLFTSKTDIRILDVGAGTGLVGLELVKRGYTKIDAVDASAPMLKIAEEKKVYQQILCHRVGETPMPLKDGSYDAVVICGAFAYNSMPVTALDESIRVVRSGGFVITIYGRGFNGDEWFNTDLEPHMKKLEGLQKWKEISLTKFTGFIDDKIGSAAVHKVL